MDNSGATLSPVQYKEVQTQAPQAPPLYIQKTKT